MCRPLTMFWKRQPQKPASGNPFLIWLILLIGVALAVVGHSVFGETLLSPTVGEAQANHPLDTATSANVLEPPPGLQSHLEQLAARYPGKNAVLVRSIDQRWVAGVRGATQFSQGTLRRIWLGAALLEAVDNGELSLDQRVPLLASGSPEPARSEKVRALLEKAVAEDDRMAQDEILAGLMGDAGMTAWLERREFEEIAFGPSNRDLARIGSSKQARGAAPDGSTPDGIAFALGELFGGRVLKEETTSLLLQQFVQQSQSPETSGWQVFRLTGVSPLVGPAVSAGAVALVRSRAGQRFVVVIFCTGAPQPINNRDRLLADAVAALRRY